MKFIEYRIFSVQSKVAGIMLNVITTGCNNGLRGQMGLKLTRAMFQERMERDNNQSPSNVQLSEGTVDVRDFF